MGHAREWDVLVERLRAHERRVVVVDQRGHGRSDRASDYSVDALAEDLIELVEALELERPSVLGHSMGGLAALVAASQRPELFDRLVLVDIVPDSVQPDAVREIGQWIRDLGAASYRSVDEAYAGWAGDPLADPALLRHYVAHNLDQRSDGRLVWQFDGAGIAGFFESLAPERLWSALAAIPRPVLLVRGEHSPLVSAESAALCQQRLQVGEIAVIEDGAHDLGVQQPRAVAEAALAFLAGHRR